MVERDPHDASAQFSLEVALFRLSFRLKHSDPAAAVATARESVRLFDEQIAAGRTSYLVISRRARALRLLAQAQLYAGQPEAAGGNAMEAVAVQRKMAARDARDLQETALLALALRTSAEAADALGDGQSAADQLTEAEQICARMYSQNRNELTLLMPLSSIRESLGTHWKKAGDQAQAWFEKAHRLWIEFPDQNDFVRRKTARVMQR